MLKKTFLVLLLSISAAASAPAGEIRLSVAASLTNAVTEICADFARTRPDSTCVPNFGSSGALAKQIAAGAPADLFISANPKWMDYLAEEKLIPAEQVRILAYNSLVLVGRKDSAISTLADVAQLRRIAIGSPKSVPAGQYTEQALKAAGLHEAMAGRLVMAQDVRQALVYADRGEADAAFVYRTDALLAKNAVILLEVPQQLYDEVAYPIGLTVAGSANPEAVAFFEHLKTPEAKMVLEKYGFAVK